MGNRQSAALGALSKCLIGVLLAASAASALAQATEWDSLRKESSKLYMQRDLDGALAAESKALAIAEKAGAHDPRIPTSLRAMGSLYSLQGKYDKAIPLYERIVALSDKGPVNRMIRATFNDLAAAYRAVGRTGDAKKIAARAAAET